MATALLLIGLSVAAALVFELHERRADRLERLNRESCELLRASRRIHDETAEAMQSMLEQARSSATAPPKHGIGR